MKLSRWLILLLALLSAGLLVGAGLAIPNAGSQVTIEQKVLAGDPEAADGVELTLPLTCGSQIFWVTTFPAGRPEEAETVFSTTLSRHTYSPPQENTPISVEISSYYGWDSAWGALEEQVWNDTPPGEERTYTFVLTDYFDCLAAEYPFQRRLLLGRRAAVGAVPVLFLHSYPGRHTNQNHRGAKCQRGQRFLFL